MPTVRIKEFGKSNERKKLEPPWWATEQASVRRQLATSPGRTILGRGSGCRGKGRLQRHAQDPSVTWGLSWCQVRRGIDSLRASSEEYKPRISSMPRCPFSYNLTTWSQDAFYNWWCQSHTWSGGRRDGVVTAVRAYRSHLLLSDYIFIPNQFYITENESSNKKTQCLSLNVFSPLHTD